MAKQGLLFPPTRGRHKKTYTTKVEAPIYYPKHPQPSLFALSDSLKTEQLIENINASNVSEDEKVFLRKAASRHTIFHYENIADYYAHATTEMQRLMEESALVIIDFEDAVAHGYVKLCEDIRKQYFEEYEENENLT
jgi:hypothetical protein